MVPTASAREIVVMQQGEKVIALKQDRLTVLLLEQNLPFATGVADRHNLCENGRIVRVPENNEFLREEAQLLAHLGV